MKVSRESNNEKYRQTYIDSCCICSQIAGDHRNDLIAKFSVGPYKRRIAFETNTFAALPSLGPLAPGHMLLCPKMHLKSLAMLQSGLARELSQTTDRLIRTLEELYQKPVHCFEHGSAAGSSRILCSTEHAHLHLVPTSVNIIPFLRSRFQWLQIEPTLDELKVSVSEREYVYYKAPYEKPIVAMMENDGFQSQLMRRIFAEALGNGVAWDWRSSPNPMLVDETYQKVAAAVL